MPSPQAPKVPYRASPFGIAKHPWVSQADTKYHPDGLYHVDVIFSPGPATEAFIAEVTAEAEAGFARLVTDDTKMTPAEKKKYRLYNPVAPEEGEQGIATGNYIAKFKQNKKLVFTEKDGSQTVKIVVIAVKDASGVTDMVKPVTGGSEIALMFKPRPNIMTGSKEAGCRLDFMAVQVKKLAVMGNQEANRNVGFGKVDGYNAEQDEPADPRDQAAFDPAEPATGSDY